MSRAFLLALQFLTRVPVPAGAPPTPAELGRSALHYPLVGLLLGAALAGLARLLAGADAGLAAALTLAAWVLATGALHLDGLADTADAWVGGIGSRERTLAIMRDPRCGPVGVVVLLLALLLKWAALHALFATTATPWLLLAPMLGRAALLVLLATAPYVRPGGLGAAHAAHLPRRAAVVVLVACACACPLLAGARGLVVLGAAAAALALWRRALRARLGGTTGDTLGAACEGVEALVLVAAALPAG